MPKRMIEAFYHRSPERVWQEVTDPSRWIWRSDLLWVRRSRDGRRIITENLDGVDTLYNVLAYAPWRWYAAMFDSADAEGEVEMLFFPENGGTRVEFTVDAQGRTLRLKLLLRLGLERWQRRYLEDLRKALRVK